MSQDRRQQLRLPVEICVQQYLSDGVYLGLTRDLSETGLYLTAPRLRDDMTLLGAPIHLEFALPGTGDRIFARGQVCESLDGDLKGLGIRLQDMADRHKQSLHRYVESVRRARLHNMLWQMNQPTMRLPGVVANRRWGPQPHREAV